MDVPAIAAGIEHSSDKGLWLVRVLGGGFPLSVSDSKAVIREVFPLPAGPTRRNVGRVVAARDRNINVWISKGVKKMTITVTIKTGREGLKNEAMRELKSAPPGGGSSGVAAGEGKEDSMLNFAN